MSQVQPDTLTAFMRRVGVERLRMQPRSLARIYVSERAHRILTTTASALYDRELATVVDVAVLPDPALELSAVRCEAADAF